jgi:hypothetical protein
MGGKAGPFRRVGIARLDGSQEEVDAAGIEFPPVPVIPDLSGTPFMAPAAQMRSRSIDTLCTRVE